MFSLTKKALLLHCALIIAIFLMFASAMPQLRQVIPALAITPTIAYQVTPGNTCDSPVLSVDPVTSPTTLSGQAINARVSLGSTFDIAFTVVARNPAGTVLSSTTVRPNALNATINIPLQANTEHRLTVSANVLITCRNSGGGVVGTMRVTRSTTVATNGSALTILQQGGYTQVPTNTVTATPTGYDLAVVNIVGGYNGPACNNQLITNVTIKNLGGSGSAPYWVSLNGVMTSQLPGLASGASVVVPFNGIVPNNTARISYGPIAPDANESNDSRTVVLPIPGAVPTCTSTPSTPVITNTPSPTVTGPGMPDLTVTSVGVTRVGGICENRWDTVVNIRNNSGVAVTTLFVVRMNTQEKTVNGLAGNTSLTVQFTGWPGSIMATVDATNVVPEYNETNNTYSLAYGPTPTGTVIATCTPNNPIVTNTPTRTATRTVTRTVTRTPSPTRTITVTPIVGDLGCKAISGTVTSGGVALSGATVSYTHFSYVGVRSCPGGITSTTTSSSGTFTLGPIFLHDTDSITVTAAKTGYISQSIVRSGIGTYQNSVFNFDLASNVTVTPSPVATITNTPVVPGTLKLQYKAANTAAGDNQFMPHFNIVNTGSSSVAMSELKIRYYFTKDGGGSLVFNCDWAAKGCANLSGAFVAISPAKSNADYYLEISFSAGAGSIAAGQSSGEIQTRNHKSDWTNFNESNDYSFDPTKTVYTDWTKVVLLRNGAVVWGTAP